MAEEKKKAAAPAAKKEAAVESTGPGANKKKGSAWTMEKVAKFARRFSNEAEWKAGHPSSYKSAMAHSWMGECKKLFRAAPSKSKGTGSLKRSA